LLVAALFLCSFSVLEAFAEAAVSDVAYDAVIKEVVPLERNGVSLYLAKYVSAQSRVDKPILLVHGLTFTSHEFDVNVKDYSFARYLAANGYTVYAIDIAGYGNSGDVVDGFEPNSDYAADDISAAVDKINEQCGTTKADVLGWSWGTVTSSRFAAKYPDKINKLVLYAPILYGFGYPAGTVTSPFTQTTYTGASEDFQMTADNQIDYSITEEIVALTYIANCWLNDPISPNGGRKDLLETPSDTLLIPVNDVKCPTLLIFGDNDPYVNVEVAQAEGEKFPEGSETIVITGGAHPLMMEKPYYITFRESVTAFLGK
jgi:pimeloyl-ACP methyl ester carboxylesterase